MNRLEKAREIVETIQDKWNELDRFYVCYSVKEVAYKVSNNLLSEFYKNFDFETMRLFCKKYKDKFKIAVLFEQEIYFVFDIWWSTGMFGDCGLHIGNAHIMGEKPEGYEDIEEILEDFEEE